MKRRAVLGTLAVAIALGGALATLGGGLWTAQARAARPNLAIDWNVNMLATLATAKVPAPAATRLAAIVQSAVFDAVNGIDRRYTSIHVAAAAPEDASKQAAAASAAYTALVSLFPAQKGALDADLAVSMAAIGHYATSHNEDGDSQAIARGVGWGKTVADQIVAWRSTDGFNSTLPPYVIGTAPADWQPTPPAFSPTPVFRTLAITTPFGLTSPSQFRPEGPPALTSDKYSVAFNEVKAFGSATSTVRTAYETETANFWQLDTATAIWNRVADSLAQQHHLSLLATAHLLARMDIAQADAAIAVWDAKNTFNFWRPVTAITQAASDGNADTSPDAAWRSLITTPGHQEYPSGHSGVSSAAAIVLASAFGEKTAFIATSDGVPGAVRSFTTFSDSVAQVADARVFAGFHFRFSCDDATQMGAAIARYEQETLMVRREGGSEQGDGGSSG